MNQTMKATRNQQLDKALRQIEDKYASKKQKQFPESSDWHRREWPHTESYNKNIKKKPKPTPEELEEILRLEEELWNS